MIRIMSESPPVVKRRKKSILWNFFTVVDKISAYCNLCQHKLSYKSTTHNLRKHIIRKHCGIHLELTRSRPIPSNVERETSVKDENGLVELYDDQNQSIYSERIDPDTTEEIVSTIISAQDRSMVTVPLPSTPSTTVPTTSTPYSAKDSFVKNIQLQPVQLVKTGKPGMKLINLFTKDFQPFRIVEDKGFREFVASLNPSYQLPTKEHLAKTVVPQLYRRCQSIVKELIKVGGVFCVTVETWTATNSESYLSVTAHYINEQFQLVSLLLDCTTISFTRNSNGFASEIKRIVSEHGIEEKIQFAVCENDSDIQNAITDVLGYEYFNCFATTINNIIREAIHSDDIISLIEKINSLVAYYKRNDDSYKKLLTCLYEGEENVTLSQISDMQYFHLIYTMLDGFLKLESAIKVHSIVREDERDDENSLILSEDEWKIANQLCQVLKPFESVIKMISDEKYCPASIVIPVVNGLQNVCGSLLKKPFSGHIRKIISDLQEAIGNNFGSVEMSATLSVCMFLDPRFKNIAFSNKSAAEHAKELVASALINSTDEKLNGTCTSKSKEIVEEEMTVWHVFDQAVAENREKQDQLSKEVVEEEISVWSNFDQTVASVKPKPTAKSQALAEIQRYLDDDIIPRKENPLLWWKENKHVYPQLSNLAKSQLCAVSTCVPCDRLFTKSGMALTERRSRLSEKTTKMLVFLNANT